MAGIWGAAQIIDIETDWAWVFRAVGNWLRYCSGGVFAFVESCRGIWTFAKQYSDEVTPGSRTGLEPRSGGKSVAVQPIVMFSPKCQIVYRNRKPYT